MTDTQQFNSTDTLIKSIDRYIVGERIGTGGMARVFRAKDKSLDRDVAVKVLHEHLADDDTFRARFEREAKFLASFHHPNVIQIYDYATVEEDSRYLCYMVMTYLPGNTLNDVMEENKAQDRLMPQQQVLQIIKDIAAALDYAHAAGMVHRDVKPGNILFDERGRAILTDFGIARMVEYSKLTQENMAVGTPAYMSPEQAAGEAVDHRTDIYALGVILYELLAGNPPFGDDGSLSVLLSHLNKPVPALTTFAHIDNDYLDSVIFKALAKMPEERYQTATEMADDLAKAIKQMKPAVMAEKTDLSTLVIPVAERAVPVVSPVNAVAGAPMDNRRTRSSTGILLIGLAIIALIVVVTFATDMFGANPPPEPVAAADGSNTIADANSIPSMTTVENMSFFSDFSENDILVGNYWSLESESVDNRPGMIVRERGGDDTYRFINTVPGRAATNMLPNYTYDTDIAVSTTVTLGDDSPDNSGYGLIFHYQDDNNFGVFAVDGTGSYSIWFRLNGEWNELRDAEDEWTPNDAVNLLGQPNRLRLEIVGTMLSGYVNDVLVTEVNDGSLTEGHVGMYLATPRSGNGAVAIYDTFEVITMDDSSISSMTSDVNN